MSKLPERSFAKLRLWLGATLALPFLAGCAFFTEDEEQLTAEEQYAEAVEFSKAGDVDKAIESYRELIAAYPQSRHAQQSLLDIAHENYRAGRYDDAIHAAEQFRQEYPTHSRVDYAYYIIGLSYFREDRALLDRFSDEDPAERDRKAMVDAYDTFTDLVRLFPDSIYYNDSLARLRYLINTLARHEAKVARYYLFRKAWVASANRASYILENFPDSGSNEEALAILIVVYASLGLAQDKEDALRVLELNYPESELKEPALEGADSLLDKLDSGRYSRNKFFPTLP